VSVLAKIKIVTDSTTDIPQAVREKYGIEMVPLKVHFDEETYLDSITIHSEEFYNKLSQAESLPTTSQPSPVEFLDTYKKLIEEDPDVCIISIHIASVLSGTYQSAVLAKSLLETQANITIIDSKSASYGIGMLVVAAAEAINQGKSLEACVEEVHALRAQTQLYFLVDTLEFLQKGGRIGKAASVLGSLLNVKPILSIDKNGEVTSVDKVRGQKKALARIIELLKKDFTADQEVNLTVAHSNALSYGEEVGNLLKQHFKIKELSFTTIGPVVGTHAGPGTIAVFVSPA
jgi:DegV family protein with EDD domain